MRSGVCAKTPVICRGPRIYLDSVTNKCLPIDSKCDQFNSLTGDCLSCLDNSQYVSSGKCVTAVCSFNQYVKKGVCIDISSSCLVYDKVNFRCNACAYGLIVGLDGNCAKIICPNRYVPNVYGNCIRVSDLCVVYNEKGACLQCIPTHIPTVDGECLQIYRQTPCIARQYLDSNNICRDADLLCDIYNNGVCTKCIMGYYLLFNNTCSNTLICK